MQTIPRSVSPLRSRHSSAVGKGSARQTPISTMSIDANHNEIISPSLVESISPFYRLQLGRLDFAAIQMEWSLGVESVTILRGNIKRSQNRVRVPAVPIEECTVLSEATCLYCWSWMHF